MCVCVRADGAGSQEAHSLMVMEMGQHVVKDYDQPLSLHQVMVPGLEDRARAFPPLSTARQLSPGSAPAQIGHHHCLSILTSI